MQKIHVLITFIDIDIGGRRRLVVDRVVSGITGKLAGEARLSLVAHLVEGKLLCKTPLSCGSITLWKKRHETTPTKKT